MRHVDAGLGVAGSGVPPVVFTEVHLFEEEEEMEQGGQQGEAREGVHKLGKRHRDRLSMLLPPARAGAGACLWVRCLWPMVPWAAAACNCTTPPPHFALLPLALGGAGVLACLPPPLLLLVHFRLAAPCCWAACLPAALS